MADEALPPFGALLREARRRAGLTHEALAERAGLSVRGISDLERGLIRAPREDTLELLARALDLSADERRQWEQARRRLARRPSSASQRLPQEQPLTNLPTPLTPLVGRRRELEDVCAKLRRADVRLLTVTGAGGIGKTRLALEVGKVLLAGFASGVYFVNLASVSDPDLVLATIASALNVVRTGDQSVDEALVARLRPSETMLILDNLEQVTSAAPSIAELLSASPQLKILATSRTPLHVSGELEFQLDPLGLPDVGRTASVQELLDTPAVSLFLSRAEAVRPDFRLTPANAADVIEICRRLDGLPLALELAAARIRVLPPAGIVQRLGVHSSLLRADARGVPVRHRTLSDTIAWSVDLLPSEHQRLFCVLSVFRGGWTLDAAESVVSSLPDELGTIDVLEGLERLVEHSLVRVREQPDGELRYSMLETIREFGLDQLSRRQEDEIVRVAFADHHVRLFESFDGRFTGPGGPALLQRCDHEHDNIRAALSWAVEHDADAAIRLVVSLYSFWWRRGHFSEARQWLRRSLESGLPITDVNRARALHQIGLHIATQGQRENAEALISDALAVFSKLDDRRGIAGCMFGLGRIAMFEREHQEALTYYDQGIAISRASGGAYLNGLLTNAGDSAAALGDHERAASYYNDALDLARSRGSLGDIAVNLSGVGLLEMNSGNLTRARELMHEALQIHAEHLPERRYATQALEERAWLAALERRPEIAARLMGAAGHERERMGVPAPPSIQAEIEQYILPAQAIVDSETWNRAWRAGWDMPLEDALAFAVSDLE